LQSLYGHYEKTFKLWEGKGIKVPPCFILVCQNTAVRSSFTTLSPAFTGDTDVTGVSKNLRQASQAVLRCGALARERSGKVGDEPEKWLRNEKS
jgi:hypothetical protein